MEHSSRTGTTSCPTGALHLVSSQRTSLSETSQFPSFSFNVSPQISECLSVGHPLGGFSLWKAAVRENTLHFKASHIVGVWSQGCHFTISFFYPSQAFITNKRNLSEKLCENVSDLPWSTDFSADRTAISSFSVRSCFS